MLALICVLSWVSAGQAQDSTPVVQATINAVPEKTYPNSYGDMWVSTWADDDNTYTVCGDGWGFGYYSQWDWHYTQVVLSSLAGSDPDNLNGTVVRGLEPVAHPGLPVDARPDFLVSGQHQPTRLRLLGFSVWPFFL